MLNPDSPLARLMQAPMQPGRVTWLGLRPARHAPVEPRATLVLDPRCGVQDDHYAGRAGTRHVTVIGATDLAAIASFLGREGVTPEQLRRNVVVTGVNLAALVGREVRLGAALLQVTGLCHPCSRMEEILGPGGYNAVRGHGGLTLRVVQGGLVQIGDALTRTERSLDRDPGKITTTG